MMMTDGYNMTSVSYANGPKAGIFKLTESEFSSEIFKSSGIVGPVTPEVNTAILTTLKHLHAFTSKFSSSLSSL